MSGAGAVSTTLVSGSVLVRTTEDMVVAKRERGERGVKRRSTTYTCYLSDNFITIAHVTLCLFYGAFIRPEKQNQARHELKEEVLYNRRCRRHFAR